MPIASTWFTRPLSSALSQATNLLFPPRCLGCARYLQPDNAFPENPAAPTDDLHHTVACPTCSPTIYRLDSPCCPQCARPRLDFPGKPAAGIDELCSQCLERPPAFEKASACFEYEGLITETIQSIKYGQQLHKIRPLARITRAWMLKNLTDITRAHAPSGDVYLLPVPMHPRDLRQRGFNPAALLLYQLTRQTPFHPRIDILHKTRHTRPQAGLPRHERFQNLRGAFTAALPRSASPEPTAILFDDVLTTSATTHEAASTLLNAGFARVRVLVIARTA